MVPASAGVASVGHTHRRGSRQELATPREADEIFVHGAHMCRAPTLCQGQLEVSQPFLTSCTGTWPFPGCSLEGS